jgi:hypothetical protein
MRWLTWIAVSVAAIMLILAPSRQPSQVGTRPWDDPTFDIYDEIASGPAD